MKTEPDAAGMNEVRLERITEHFSSTYVEPGKIAGCQVTVVRGGHVAYHRSLGLMDREQQTPMADDAIFRIYSMTKPIASVALDAALRARACSSYSIPCTATSRNGGRCRSAWSPTTAPSPWRSPSAP